VGGDLRSDLLKDADSLSYFDVNLPLYFERNGWQETHRRCVWGYRRLSERARSMAAGLTWRGKELDDLMDEAIREAGVGVTTPASPPWGAGARPAIGR
jgi:hypothetical protein